MKGLIETLKNIWKIDDLRSRILTTLGLVLVYRLGTMVVLPGIDPAHLGALKSQTADGVLGLLDMFPEEHFRMHRSSRWELCLTSQHLL